MVKTEPELKELEVYFDYLCPFAFTARSWLRDVEKEMGEKLPLKWRYFSLEQANRKDNEKNVWDADYDRKTRGIPAFRASEAVRRQGEDLFLKFQEILFDAYHMEFQDLSSIEVLKKTAEKAGSDVDRFLEDFNDPSSLDGLITDHNHAVDDLKIFGTPTFVFNGGSPVYLKLDPDDFSDGLDFFLEFVRIGAGRPNVLEIKRP